MYNMLYNTGPELLGLYNMDQTQTGQPRNVAEPVETEETHQPGGGARITRRPEDPHLLWEVDVLEELHVAQDGSSSHLHPTGERCMHLHLFPDAPPAVLDLATRIEAMIVDMFRLHAELKGQPIVDMPGAEVS